MSTEYQPEYPSEMLAEYMYRELQRISQELERISQHLDVVYVEPDRPRQGDIRYADGTSWDPGSGEGIYRHNGTAWVFVG